MEKILFIVYLCLSIGGMILVKIGVSNPLSIVLKSGNLSVSAGFVTITGLILYIGSFLIWTKLVTMYDLSYFVPLAAAITQVVVLILAVVFFKESITLLQFIGILFAVTGIILMNWK